MPRKYTRPEFERRFLVRPLHGLVMCESQAATAAALVVPALAG